MTVSDHPDHRQPDPYSDVGDLRVTATQAGSSVTLSATLTWPDEPTETLWDALRGTVDATGVFRGPDPADFEDDDAGSSPTASGGSPSTAPRCASPSTPRQPATVGSTSRRRSGGSDSDTSGYGRIRHRWERRHGEVCDPGRWGDLDVDGARRGHKADRLVAGRPARRPLGLHVHVRPGRAPAEPGATHIGRLRRLPARSRGRVRGRRRLRPTGEGLRLAGRGRAAALQPRALPRLPPRPHHRRPPTRPTCGWACGGSRG